MSGSKSTNNSSLQFQQQQAAEAKVKEAQRAQRLQQGQSAIDAIYDGSPVMGTRSKAFDWSGFKAPQAADAWGQGATSASGLPAGYTARAVQTARAPSPGGYNLYGGGGENNWLSGGYHNAGGDDGNGPATQAPPYDPGYDTSYEVVGPDGKVHKQGEAFNYDETYDTGQKSGGFGSGFYDKFKQAVLDYYRPEVDRQFQNAKSDLTFSLARTGNLNSSAAGQKQGALEYEKRIQDANVVNNADQQTSQLKSSVAQQRKSLIDQLYTTEDPTLAANLAQSSANGLQLQTPTLTPAASLFSPLLSAVGGALTSYTSPYGSQPQAGGGITRPSTGGSSKAYGGQ